MAKLIISLFLCVVVVGTTYLFFAWFEHSFNVHNWSLYAQCFIAALTLAFLNAAIAVGGEEDKD